MILKLFHNVMMTNDEIIEFRAMNIIKNLKP